MPSTYTYANPLYRRFNSSFERQRIFVKLHMETRKCTYTTILLSAYSIHMEMVSNEV